MLIKKDFYNRHVAITELDEKLTYRDAARFSNDIGKYLSERCLIFCLVKNNIESLFGYVASVENKVVTVLLDAELSVSNLKKLLKAYSPNYLWLEKQTCQKHFSSNKVLFGYKNYSLVKYSNTMVSVNNDLALLLTTSGSTGSPKLVRLSYKNVLENAKSIKNYLSLNKDEKPITSLPMFYSFGLSVINSHLLSGSEIVLTNSSITQKKFWDLVKKHSVTSLSGVPYTYQILKRFRFFRMDLPSLKTLTQAGGKLNNELVKEFAEHARKNNREFIGMYGQTEATARMSYLPFNLVENNPDSIGFAIPNGKLKIIDESGNEVDEEEHGELVYSGPNVSLGYSESNLDLIKGDENNQILKTGDIAQKDKSGLFYIVGRKKRFIKLFGNRVSLDEAESLLKNLIADCACVGDDDKMEIYLSEKNREKEIIDYISKKLGIHYSAFIIKFIAEIPKSSSGKTLYAKLN